MKHHLTMTATVVAILAAIFAGARPVRGGGVSFFEHVISTDAVFARDVFATDLDGDGDTDVLSASDLDDKIAWYENDGGSPVVFFERVISTVADGASSVFAADIDGDGDIDVLSGSTQDAKLAWYENDGALPPSFTERVVSIGFPLVRDVFAADVDGDGDMDILIASRISDTEIPWYENNGGSPPTFAQRVIPTTSNSPWDVFADDVDGDGDTDVLTSSSFDGKITWYESDGASPPAFTEHVISATAPGSFSVITADIDGDGDMDVLSAASSNDEVSWYESDGALPPTFTERVISNAAMGAQSVFAIDLDADGDLDVLSASRIDNKIAWYESDGASPPNFDAHVISTSAVSAASVFAADVDGDGDVDVLSASSFDFKIAWYEQFLLPTPVVPTVSEWGLVTMSLLLLISGTLVYARRTAVHTR